MIIDEDLPHSDCIRYQSMALSGYVKPRLFFPTLGRVYPKAADCRARYDIPYRRGLGMETARFLNVEMLKQFEAEVNIANLIV